MYLFHKDIRWSHSISYPLVAMDFAKHHRCYLLAQKWYNISISVTCQVCRYIQVVEIEHINVNIALDVWILGVSLTGHVWFVPFVSADIAESCFLNAHWIYISICEFSLLCIAEWWNGPCTDDEEVRSVERGRESFSTHFAPIYEFMNASRCCSV